MGNSAFTEKLIKFYANYYDIHKEDISCEPPLIARCDCHAHSEKFVLSKKAKLWEADSHEYVYIFDCEHLTKELVDKWISYVYGEGLKLINPKPGHMYSYLTAVFVCISSDKDAIIALKKCRLHKNFRFSLHGWMDFHTALVLTGDVPDRHRVITNPSGRDNAKILKRLLKNIKKEERG